MSGRKTPPPAVVVLAEGVERWPSLSAAAKQRLLVAVATSKRSEKQSAVRLLELAQEDTNRGASRKVSQLGRPAAGRGGGGMDMASGRSDKYSRARQGARTMQMLDLGEEKQLQRQTAAAVAPKKKEAARRKREPVPDPFAGAVQAQEDGTAVYYQDRRKQWPYTASAAGASLLQRLLAEATPLLRLALQVVSGEERDDPDGAELRREGERIYAQKPNMRAGGITWSQENYAHLGLQAEYLRLKSIQRITEGTVAMERAYNAGAFAALRDARTKTPFRVASLGGGPGFELLAVREFCAARLPQAEPQLLSLDLQGAWRPCCEALGLRFEVWDVMDGDGLLGKTGWPAIDLAVISYVYYHYMSNEHCADWLARLLHAGAVKAVLIISRFEDLSQNLDAVARRGVHEWLPCSFPNVPFEDQKAATQAEADKSYRQRGTAFDYSAEQLRIQ
ncbi:hypothetical protein EMIHUDRAFT_451679 [Emiliania huxleyi CCMP1516]|uniref:Uncharacterized protein n=2 Tax=Emiliania huxleyi TaxID=2903 RepID=A0A0D3IWS8_EMIH1|nr:hypothetical protein EMIHUDRAFT_451679 [Emiliania huxleyi CCMP1516]EOD15713.1 hypothetical protein EMIHUDRAFT_451679 [Emiliania huxleyi CCMP1516]|eukprot:XP_005768142.1 hypothetical protein EMIHUDRAFT_451679 [Emiliania huxleyi CCMP1516]